MTRRKDCVYCGGTDHRVQDDDHCPERDAMDAKDRSDIAKKGWETRRRNIQKKIDECELKDKAGRCTHNSWPWFPPCAFKRKIHTCPEGHK